MPRHVARRTSVWRDVAAAIDKSHRDKVLGPGWEGFLDVARRIAASGVPVRASPSAVWCLVAAMVVCGSPKAASWARTLTRLAGHVHCPDCDTVWAIADVMGDSGTDDARLVSMVSAVDNGLCVAHLAFARRSSAVCGFSETPTCQDRVFAVNVAR